MTAGATNFPTSLDTTTNLPLAATLAAIELDGDGTDDQKHSNWAGVVGGGLIALETKIGTGASTPIANAVLAGSAAGVAGWDTTPGLLGVTFPASQSASGDANTLDDYEEGTFTPAIADDSGDGSGEGQTYAIQNGVYVKVGRLVTFTISLEVTSLGTLTAGDAAKIVGLPFTHSATVNTETGVFVGWGISLAMNNASENLSGYISTNSTQIILQLWDAVTGPTNLLLSEYSAGGRVMVAGHYYVD